MIEPQAVPTDFNPIKWRENTLFTPSIVPQSRLSCCLGLTVLCFVLRFNEQCFSFTPQKNLRPVFVVFGVHSDGSTSCDLYDTPWVWILSSVTQQWSTTYLCIHINIDVFLSLLHSAIQHNLRQCFSHDCCHVWSMVEKGPWKHLERQNQSSRQTTQTNPSEDRLQVALTHLRLSDFT